ncbi:MAG: class I SAM-dependent methyltransferase [bacterium]|jgi:SAM-dependent methyltransferase
MDECLVCNAVEHDLRFSATFAGTAADAHDYFLAHRAATARGDIVRCRQCGFVFTSPRFSDDDYDRIYKAVPRPELLDASFTAAKSARFKRLSRIVREFQPSPVPFLDFGCGDGSFLREFGSAAGTGFEIGPSGRHKAGPCDVITGDWAVVAASPALREASFDFAVAFDVLEHLPRIERDVAAIRRVLKPNGLLFATVPNIRSWVARAMGSRWNMLLLEHLWYFNPETFSEFMARQGFTLLETRAVPFDAPLAHLFTRLAQTFGMKGQFSAGPVSRLVVPVPAGLMLGVFRSRQ